MVRRPASRRALALGGGALVGLVVAVVIALALTGSTDAGGLRLRACTIGQQAAECGQLKVAENPAAPRGRKIALNVAVFRATGPSPKPDPLFWFAGWGGAGVSDDAAGVISAFRRVNVDRDIVFVDQRGTGSSKLVCQLPRTAAPVPSAITAAVRACADRIGPNLRYYTTAIAVDDFDRVRAALGYGKINLYGGSYGVTAEQVYLLRHRRHVRSAIFDSGSLLDVRIFERGARNSQRALDILFARCAADTSCNTAYPNLRAEFNAVRTRVERAPIAVPGKPVRLTPATLAGAIANTIAYTNGKAMGPRLIHLIATGRLAEAAKIVPPTSDANGTELAYKLVIQCSEHWASWRPDPVRRQAAGTYLAPMQNRNATEMAAVCKALPRVAVPAATGRRVRSRLPILILTGNEDPADPPANVRNAQRELPNSLTVVFPRSGHGQLGLLCSQNLIADFVASGTARGLDVACARTAVTSEFDVRS